jgi:Protein of unknown function (DUF1569)
MWDAGTPREIHNRVGRLTPDRKGDWGRMSASQMVCHLGESLKMALGELPVAPKSSLLRYPPLKQFIVYVAPFPKNVPTAPELLLRTPSDWTGDVTALLGLVDCVVARGRSATWEKHPVFGALSPRAWGVLMYRHIDHHLRQFGA